MTAYVLAATLYVLLGVAYVKGYDLVKARSPESVPQFYMAMAVVRMLLVLTAIGIFLITSDSKQASISFVLANMAMYITMMVVSLTLRH